MKHVPRLSNPKHQDTRATATAAPSEIGLDKL